MKHINRSLLEWLKTAGDADISETSTTRAYLRMIGYGWKIPSAQMAVGIEKATSGLVTRKDLRPNDWQKLWPELSELAATLSKKIRHSHLSDQSGDPSVHLSSTSQASA